MGTDIDWIDDLLTNLPAFLNRLRYPSGLYRFVEAEERKDPYLSPLSYGLKISYAAGLPAPTQASLLGALAPLATEGMLFDRTIYRKSWFKNWVNSVRQGSLRNNFGTQYKVAETRQVLSSLDLHGLSFPGWKFTPYLPDYSLERFRRYNWTYPWSAGSWLSHLAFFLRLARKDRLIDEAFYQQKRALLLDFFSSIQSPETGFWGSAGATNQQLLNGAMKVWTALENLEVYEIEHPRQQIDSALGITNDAHACDHFNVIYVLTRCARLEPNYRRDEITAFIYRRLELYRDYYHPGTGGFSFFKNKSNTHLYGCRVSAGENVPDIHGTVLFLWGVAVMLNYLENSRYQLKEFIP